MLTHPALRAPLPRGDLLQALDFKVSGIGESLFSQPEQIPSREGRRGGSRCLLKDADFQTTLEQAISFE
ncbi:MAG: hypothetical protein WA949_19200 [Phormidesmis sp.]